MSTRDITEGIQNMDNRRAFVPAMWGNIIPEKSTNLQ